MTVRDAISQLSYEIAYLAQLDPRQEVNLQYSLEEKKSRHIFTEGHIPYEDDIQEKDIIHFIYIKDENAATRDDLIRVGQVLVNNRDRRSILLWDFNDNRPKTYLHDKMCNTYILRELP